MFESDFYDDHEPKCCPICGKEYEDFSDLGCPACDQRHPNFGQPIQVKLIGEYFIHYINAPCWVANCGDDEEMSDTLVEARALASKIETVVDIDHFISKCMEIGLDPL